ncbi:MAG: ZPR1 zinc finger domain-containing protein [Candidatus Hodarchaeota archaeon]
MAEEDSTAVTCPACEEAELDVQSMLYSVPYFNELAMFTMKCPKCHFSHNDVFSAEQRPPSRWTLKVDDAALLRVRVVRSSSGTVRLPELGIDIEPGPAAESYISNVEGVLLRTRPIVDLAARNADTSDEKERGYEIVEKIDKALNGNLTFSIVIEDPAGVSGILPDDLRLVKREELSQEEASILKGAPMWVDIARQDYSERKA